MTKVRKRKTENRKESKIKNPENFYQIMKKAKITIMQLVMMMMMVKRLFQQRLRKQKEMKKIGPLEQTKKQKSILK